MKNTFLISVLYWFCITGNAQNFLQKRLYTPKSANAFSYDIIESSTGNFVLIGPSLDTINGQLQNNLMVMGIDNNGIVQWRKHYGNNNFSYATIGGSYGLCIKQNGYIYSVGMVHDSNNVYPGYFMKLKYNGDTLWQRKIYDVNPSTQFFLTKVTPTYDNGFLILGAIQTNTPGFNNHPIVGLYLAKSDTNGNKLWEKRIYKSDLDKTIIGEDLVQDSASKKIIIAEIEDYDTGGNGSSILILDSVGNVIAKKRNSLVNCDLLRLKKLRDGKIIGCGISNNNTQLINGFPTSYALLFKCDSNGDQIFFKFYDTLSVDNAFTSIDELPNGDIIAGGMQELNLKYKYAFNTVPKVMRIDKNGNLIWKKYYDNITSSEDFSNEDVLESIRVTSNNQIVFTSATRMTTVCPVTFMFYKTDTTYCDPNAIACYNYETTGILHNKILISDIEIWPNPCGDILHFKNADQRDDLNSLCVINTLGQEIIEFKNIKNEINISNLTPGVYYLKFSIDSRINTKLFIKE